MMLTRGTRSRRGSRGGPLLHGRGAQRGGRAAAAAAPAAAPDSAPLDALPPLPGTEPLGAPLDPNEEDDDNLPSLQGGAQAAGSSSSRPAEHTVRRVPRTDLTEQLAGSQQLSEHQHSGTLINAAVAGAAASSPVVLAMPVQSTPPIPAAPPPLHQGSGGPPVLRSLQQVPHLQASDLQGTPPSDLSRRLRFRHILVPVALCSRPLRSRASSATRLATHLRRRLSPIPPFHQRRKRTRGGRTGNRRLHLRFRSMTQVRL